MNRIGWSFLAAIAGVVALLIVFSGTPRPIAEAARPNEHPGTEARVPQPNVALIVPVAGVARQTLTDTWGQSREGGLRAHEAIDIMAPGGTPVLAAFAGRVEKLFESARGGTTVYIRSVDGRLMSYYAHLASYAPGLAEGQRVAQGQRIGLVGDTGDAGPGNTHLHFALARMRAGERWWQGAPFNPYPLLAAKAAGR